jgi:transcriptional regulator with XRE-family HTH domain
MAGGGPTIRRRRLGRALRDLRIQKGLTGEEAGQAVERSGSWISRVEGGRVGLRIRELRDLLDRYGMGDPRRREELEALAREGQQRGWWSRYADALPEPLIVFLGLEEAARSIRGYYDHIVPGLLQTEAYCRAVHLRTIGPAGTLPPEQVDKRVRARMDRQAQLRQDPPKLQLILDEAVLYRTIGGRDVLREQLEYLVLASRKRHVTLRIVPFSRGDQIVFTNSFSIMGFREDPEIVWLETPLGLTYEDGDKEIEIYRGIFERLAETALGAEDTAALINMAKDRLA